MKQETPHDVRPATEAVRRFSAISNDLRKAADKVDELAGPASEIPDMPRSDSGKIREDLRDLGDAVLDVGARIANEGGAPGRDS